jgi:hypothetical protein
MYASYASLLPHRCSNAYSFAEIFFNPHDSHPSVFAKASRFAISPSNRARTPASAVSRITNSFLASYGPVLAPAAARTTTAERRPDVARDATRGESIIRVVVVIIVVVIVVFANIVRVSSRRTVRRGALGAGGAQPSGRKLDCNCALVNCDRECATSAHAGIELSDAQRGIDDDDACGDAGRSDARVIGEFVGEFVGEFASIARGLRGECSECVATIEGIATRGEGCSMPDDEEEWWC